MQDDLERLRTVLDAENQRYVEQALNVDWEQVAKIAYEGGRRMVEALQRTLNADTTATPESSD